jgi:hypothetical protein
MNLRRLVETVAATEVLAPNILVSKLVSLCEWE